MAIVLEKNGTLEYWVAEGITVSHCFTTRLGGVSQGHLGSLNLGIHRGDDPAAVAENYRILADALSFDAEKLVATHQIHSDLVLPVGREQWGNCLIDGTSPDCDGLITCTPGTVLVIYTADCTPILLHDPVTGAVGAVHAGWRGTAADIGGKAVAAMQAHYGCDPKNIRAAIGPNIGQCCFQTDGDVPQAMGRQMADCVRQAGSKYFVDLKRINARLLRRAGVEHIEISTECTACAPDRYWSHRIHGPQRGSQGAIILCQEVSK